MNTAATILTATINLSKEVAARAAALCDDPPGSTVRRDDPVYVWRAKFEDGRQADIKVIAPSDPDEDPCWSEGVLFDAEGRELAICSGDDGDPTEDWEFLSNGVKYVVKVEADG